MDSNLNPYRIREYTIQDKDEALALIDIVWDKYSAKKIHKTWNWLFESNPFIPRNCPYALVLEYQGKIVGLMCDIFEDLKVGNKTIKIRCGYNFSIHPSHRGKGIRLFKQNLKFLGYPIFGFPTGRTTELEVKLGLHKIGNVYRLIHILNMKNVVQVIIKNKVLSSLSGFFGNLFMKFLSVKITSSDGTEINQINYFDQEVDDLWKRLSKKYEILIVRDQKYLNWRFLQSPFAYSIFVAEKQKSFLGYIVLREVDKMDLHRGIIVDLFADPEDRKTIDLLLDKAISYFTEKKVDFIEYRGLLNRKEILNSLRKKFFLFKVFLNDFLIYVEDKEMSSKLLDYSSWFITANEPDVDFL